MNSRNLTNYDWNRNLAWRRYLWRCRWVAFRKGMLRLWPAVMLGLLIMAALWRR